MNVARVVLVACLSVSEATALAARERVRAPLPQPRKNDAGLVVHPIKPMDAHEEKPRVGWSGFYGGLNAGAGFGDTENR